ncbi:DUF5403 family protein [Haloglycomyces albus]|uniref:DUF5403 family protein n=1 Tax=Haloglycomyces albus TaxID=526067 RepID=UPI00046C9F22|nr:DUF5403 family protein [Haloglycomyces albus]
MIVIAHVYKRAHVKIAGMRSVLRVVRAEADKRAHRARVQAAQHTRTGTFLDSIRVRRYKKGYAVQFEDRQAALKNFGHINRDTGEWVDGVGAVEAALRQ